MKLFYLFSLLVHVLFLLSIFHIYFQSPVLKNLPIGTDNTESIANRVVVFVADGLRAESFLQNGANRTKFLQQTIISNGAFGISHTRVPTESRPGHVALFAGIYEDPSAIFKGWKKNPVDFDSIFNRSRSSFIWGSPDILPIFLNGAEDNKIYAHHYPADFEKFSGNSNTSELDIWVLDQVETFFSVPQNQNILKSNEKLILFLHLLGLDTAGHVHKPYSKQFSENLAIVDKGVHKIVDLIEGITNSDGKTAYIFTSDHGMTDRGSHGSGHPSETETPFVAWGAGVQHWKNIRNEQPSNLSTIFDGVNIPRWDVNQADVCPLISTLLGLAIPKNNCGKVPRRYLNASESYVANAMRKNAEQLYQQYQHWKHRFSNKFFHLNWARKENYYSMQIANLWNAIKSSAAMSYFEQMITLSDNLIDVTLQAIEFYQTYYKFELLFMISLAMVGWIANVIGIIIFPDNMYRNLNIRLILVAFGIMFIIYVYYSSQGASLIVIFYFLFPIMLWIPVLGCWKQYVQLLHFRTLFQSVLFIGCIELCVASFFQRKVLSIFLIANIIIFVNRLLHATRKYYGLIATLVFCNSLLAIFPILPVIEKDYNMPYLLILGIIVWVMMNIVVACMAYKTILHRTVQLCFCVIVALNTLYSLYVLENGSTVSWFSKLFSWILLGSSFILPLFTERLLLVRLASIMINLTGPLIMLSLSYEPLFMISFSASILVWIYVENIISDNLDEISTMMLLPTISNAKNQITFEDYRRSLTFVFYMLISFFGTGNVASVSSFDPNWVRLFISSFAPFTMMGLIVLKLLIPVFILVCILKTIHIITRVQLQNMFLIILIICDSMCLHFLHLVKTEGSWLDIGSSISHFVIMECTTIFLIIMYGGVKIFTEVLFLYNKSLKNETKIRSMLPYNYKINKD